MIPDQWYGILEASRVGRKPVGLRRMGEQIVLFRDSQGALQCLVDRCPHKGVRLSEGKVVGDTLRCAYHGFRFASDGTCVEMPVLGAAKKPPRGMCAQARRVRERYGLVWLWWGDDRPDAELPEIPMFDAFKSDDWRISRYGWEVPIHYTRYVESLCEIYHVPWVHLSKFNPIDLRGTRLDDYTWSIDGNHIKSEFLLRPDDARDGHAAEHAWLPWRRGWRIKLEVMMPNMNYGQFPWTRIMSISTPIDDENTWICFIYRSPHGNLVLPPQVPTLPMPGPVGKAWSWFLARYERITPQSQDFVLLQNQQPRVAEQGSNMLTAADRLNIAFLKQRDKLKAEAALRRRRANITLVEEPRHQRS